MMAGVGVVAEDPWSGHHGDAALLGLFGKAVAIEAGVADDDFQVEFIVQNTKR
jgi:hypothetical protein